MDGSDELLTPTLIKAARALLRIDQEKLSKIAGITRKTIGLIEVSTSKRLDPRRRETLERLRQVLEDDLGVVFTFANENTGEGVRLRTALTDE